TGTAKEKRKAAQLRRVQKRPQSRLRRSRPPSSGPNKRRPNRLRLRSNRARNPLGGHRPSRRNPARRRPKAVRMTARNVGGSAARNAMSAGAIPAAGSAGTGKKAKATLSTSSPNSNRKPAGGKYPPSTISG